MPAASSRPTFSAFGQTVTLDAGGDAWLRDDSLWRLREIYQPALGTAVLARAGHAVDIGAGFGVFAIPFALAWPDWTVTCFEPDETACALLSANVAEHGLTDRIAIVRAAVAPVPDVTARDLDSAMRAGGAAALAGLARPFGFFQDREKPGFLSSGADPDWRAAARAVDRPALPPQVLSALRPDLIKLVCPGHEHAVLTAFVGTPARVIVGECWTPPPTEAVLGPDAPEAEVHIPLAGSPMRLQRTAPPPGLRHGLDVVVAMYNARDYILDCVNGIIGTGAPQVRAVVVDDGSTDGCGDLVRQTFGDDPRVRVISKPNGGCASARNYGRMHSDASHIAFVDADDVPGPDLFPALLELSRYSGVGAVQAAFDMLHDDPGGPRFVPSYEAADFAHVPRRPFGSAAYFALPWDAVVVGQPTIWRRVYRRDFLDAKSVWFPEHIRAFDDQIFQMLSAYYSGTVYARDDVTYHYRQHPAQDIRQGDERMIYSLEMYRLVLKRAVAEGWPQFGPFAVSYFNTLEWVSAGIRDDLKPGLLQGAAELWVYMQKVFGRQALGFADRTTALDPAFGRHAAKVARRLDRFGDSYAWAYLDAPDLHPDMVRARNAARRGA